MLPCRSKVLSGRDALDFARASQNSSSVLVRLHAVLGPFPYFQEMIRGFKQCFRFISVHLRSERSLLCMSSVLPSFGFKAQQVTLSFHSFHCACDQS